MPVPSGIDIVQDGWADEVAFLVAADSGITAIHHRLRAAADALGDQRLELVRLSPEMTGPISVPASRPYPTLREAAASLMRSVNGFAASATVITTDDARQRCPAHPNAESATIFVVISRSASGRTTIGFFAPPWHCTRFPLAAARL